MAAAAATGAERLGLARSWPKGHELNSARGLHARIGGCEPLLLPSFACSARHPREAPGVTPLSTQHQLFIAQPCDRHYSTVDARACCPLCGRPS